MPDIGLPRSREIPEIATWKGFIRWLFERRPRPEGLKNSSNTGSLLARESPFASGPSLIL
jgi:hypothetical protein